ncbi:MAG: single-stranded-DNA-specific exonuclease RecJ [Verrucomicrobiota bacterium]|jgi:single-stranded-DNA-specific exonuclease
MRWADVEWILRGESFQMDESDSTKDFPAILEHLVRQRNIALENSLDRFLDPKLKDLSDPFLLPEMDLAVARLFTAIDQGQSIGIFGDYDVDGVTSISVIYDALRQYGIEPRYFVPQRSSEGYGLSMAALERFERELGLPDLLIAVDCGTSSVDEIAMLQGRGIDVIVFDHHEPGLRGRPPCVALVNPKCGSDFPYLCAAGVCFKVVHAMLKIRPLPNFDLKDFLDRVSVATIADIVPMIGENRLIVRHGLKRLPKSKNLGLQALQKAVGMNGSATSMDVGFRIGPRLNAAGRMDQPEMALATLLTQDESEAEELAAILDDFNRERQSLEERMRREALAMMKDFENDPVIVLGSRDWHPGVVGIVASRLMRQYHRPTFIISIDDQGIGKGSGRSIHGVSLVAAIEECRSLLVAGGGHEMAAGISIEESRLDAFRQKFAEHVLQNTTTEQRMPKIYLDAELSFDWLSLDFLKSYELLQPFGSGNPQPVFYARNVFLSRPPMHLKNKHLRLFLRQGKNGLNEQSAMFFNGGERQLPDPPWDIAFTIDRNTFRGVTSLQVVITDVRAARPDVS